MAEGLSTDLLFAAGATLFACFAVLAGRLGILAGWTVALIKVGITVVYFGVVGASDFRILDDVTYAEEAAEMLAAGSGPLGLVVDPVQSQALFEVAGGRHVGYYVYNALAQWIFGDHYWAAVFLNLLLTCVAARGLYRIVELLDMAPGLRAPLLVFFLLHWDVLAWSSLLNLKDTLVMCVTCWLTYFLMAMTVRVRGVHILGILISSLLLFFVRYYVPLLCLTSLGLWLFFHRGGTTRMLLTAGATLGVGFLWLLRGRWFSQGVIQTDGVFEGMLRFLVTPRPWGIEDNYRFVLFPSVLHWMLLPVALYEVLRFERVLARNLVLFFALMVFFYGFFPRLQGPRHRYQLAFVLALFQFHGVAVLATRAFGAPRAPRLPAKPLDAHA